MRNEKMKKSVIAVLTTMVIIVSFLGVAFYAQTVQAADPTDWYITVNGVLDSDTYVLYPYELASLKVGISKFGELINSNTNVGLEYDGARDPFAAPAGSSIDESKLPKKVWINGWYIDIRYVHEDWGPRNVWAGALFADKSDYGKNWIRVDNNYTYPLEPMYEWQETFDDKGKELGTDLEPIPGLVYGGRKTNGTAVTEPLQVLYDGPRLFVAKSTTRVYDWHEETNENLPLVDVTLTIIFNKVKKEVIVLKDVKFIDQAKYVLAELPITVDSTRLSIPYGLLIQFSNREEWDLGAKGVSGTTDYSSYVHFYTAGNGTAKDTVYNEDWTMLPTLPAGVVYDGVTINAHGSEPGPSGTYDVAQIISNDELYVGWHAFWPSLSDWSADAARGSVKTWYRAMTADDPHYIDSYSGIEPFLAPLVVGEWDFILADAENTYDGVTVNRQFRGVSVYGVTDLNDGDDANIGSGHQNTLDTEVLYQLNEIFNPWDLYDAVNKDTQRWVEYHHGTTSWKSAHKPVMDVSDEEWDDYCVFSERVEDLTAGTVLARGDYTFYVDDDGYAHITGLSSTHYYKILYSTDTVYGYEGSITFANYTWSNISASDSNILNDQRFDFIDGWEDWLGATHGVRIVGNITITNVTAITGNHTWTYSDSFNPFAYDVKVFKEDVTYLGVWEAEFAPTDKTDGGNTTRFNLEDIELSWSAEGPGLLDLHIDYLDVVVNFEVTLTYNATSGNYTVNLVITFEPYPENDYLYLEHIPGRYEWVIVGRDAASVDSAGAALVTAAFKNKQVEIGLAGADMYNPTVSLQMPWVMSKIGTGTTRENYYYSGTDYRTALKDDWCTTWPIASSNIIVEAGPRANVLAWYGNDFAQAFFGLTEFTDYAPWDTAIIPLTCWNTSKTRTYSDSGLIGYAAISTYKDINGTVLFNIWGYNGIDTYYVSKWFHEEGIYQLQEAPRGLTSIIVKITYQSTSEGYKPTRYSIVECLGTISETEWTHNAETKGGIHDP
jgi:hypothetical protein